MYDYGREYEQEFVRKKTTTNDGEPKKFPYFTFRVLGILLILVGICAIVLGAAFQFYLESLTGWPTADQCSTGCFIARTVPGIWGGIFAIAAGATAVQVRESKSGGLKKKKYVAGIMAGLFLFLFGVGAIALIIIQLLPAYAITYVLVGGNMTISNTSLFALLVLVGIFLLVAWFLCLAVFILVYTSPKAAEVYDPYLTPYRLRQDALPPTAYGSYPRPTRPLEQPPPVRRLDNHDYRPPYYSEPNLYRPPPSRPYIPRSRPPPAYPPGMSRADFDRRVGRY